MTLALGASMRVVCPCCNRVPVTWTADVPTMTMFHLVELRPRTLRQPVFGEAMAYDAAGRRQIVSVPHGYLEWTEWCGRCDKCGLDLLRCGAMRSVRFGRWEIQMNAQVHLDRIAKSRGGAAATDTGSSDGGGS